MAEERHIWECTDCGEIWTEPKRKHRHAEGPAALGVYYAVVRLTVKVVEAAHVEYIDHKWVHTPLAALNQREASPATDEHGMHRDDDGTD